MFYKRAESFRYTFGAPPEIKLMVMDSTGNLTIYCLLLDISPKGAKLFSEKELELTTEIVSLKFILNHEKITAEAKIVWKHCYESGWLYGVDFERNPVKELLISTEIRELKEVELH
ncbi:PilZ domain-containing protein [Planococcus donghaensis]|uniref:PilZ domain-containing protein n=1 Tax=Planococcus donghaensis TaxID=414778 RepID=A0A1C7EG43_9BACL|nr:PilZ domain-containing protein [Planococcus donghaensis]ANU22665.1 PilZ domain-containing protein [Planococcus donghaensis]